MPEKKATGQMENDLTQNLFYYKQNPFCYQQNEATKYESHWGKRYEH